MKAKRVIIVGGGASGLVAAITAARNGADVTIIEQKEKLGKKILSTGNGRCNLTNEYMEFECFRGDDTSVVSKVLEQFGYKDTVTFFEGLGVILKNRQGYFYPISDQASAILDVLCFEIRRLNICVVLEESVKAIQKNSGEFTVKTTKNTYTCDALILSTGGRAASVLGSDGSGYGLAKSFGHTLSPVVPALVQLVCAGKYFKLVSGVRTNATVKLFVNRECAAADTGELQLTNYGISGIPVFQVSRYAAKALHSKNMVFAEIDFLPTMTEEELRKFISVRKETHGNRLAEEFFIGMLNSKLAVMLLKEAYVPTHISVNEIREDKWDKLLELIKHFRTEVVDTNSFEQAQVCAGGVRTSEINVDTMESIFVENLYLTGELLDVDGICGGYNLHWAWATGHIAGKNAAKGK